MKKDHLTNMYNNNLICFVCHLGLQIWNKLHNNNGLKKKTIFFIIYIFFYKELKK